MDSYLSDGESDGEYEGMPPPLAAVDFENSLIRSARSLLQAATTNPIEGTCQVPAITLRLTRLDPNLTSANGEGTDPRIRQTINVIRDMGIDVQLGERSEAELARNSDSLQSTPRVSLPIRPTRRITLDLSALIALVSDLTHFPLPSTTEEAHARFIPPQEYRTWKETRIANKKPQDKIPQVFPERTIEDLPKVYVKQARALTRQLLQEMIKGLIQEVHDQLAIVTDGDFSNVEFWVTPEARSRCLLIVNKIGGANEKRRVHALLDHGDDLKGGIQSYWKGSRYPIQYIPILPIKIFPTSSNPEPVSILGRDACDAFRPSPFTRVLKKTCEYILAHEVVPDPRSSMKNQNQSHHHHHDDNDTGGGGGIQRAPVTQLNPKLTAHTVQSMLWGAELGWTTLTGNRSSVKAILRAIKSARVSGRLAEVVVMGDDDGGGGGSGGRDGDNQSAAIWVVDPRSLAEGMSSLPNVD
jgi:hypothetical protein